MILSVFVFGSEVGENDKELVVDVEDWDFIGKNDPMGGARLTLSSLKDATEVR